MGSALFEGGSVRNQDTGQPLVYTRSLISDQPVSLYFLESREGQIIRFKSPGRGTLRDYVF